MAVSSMSGTRVVFLFLMMAVMAGALAVTAAQVDERIHRAATQEPPSFPGHCSPDNNGTASPSSAPSTAPFPSPAPRPAPSPAPRPESPSTAPFPSPAPRPASPAPSPAPETASPPAPSPALETTSSPAPSPAEDTASPGLENSSARATPPSAWPAVLAAVATAMVLF